MKKQLSTLQGLIEVMDPELFKHFGNSLLVMCILGPT